MPATHCLPNGALGTSELSVPNVSAPILTTATPAGAKRGVIVLFPGLGTTVQTNPQPFVDTGGFLPVKLLTLANSLTADGWVLIQVPTQEQGFNGPSCNALFNDVSADPLHGARYLASTLHLWDHIVAYVQSVYGANIPIVCFGISAGGWQALQVAANRASTIVAIAAHIYVTILSDLVTFAGINWSALNSTGYNAPATILNGFKGPILLSFHSDDNLIPTADPKAVADAAIAAGLAVTTFPNPTSGANTGAHALTLADDTNIMSWFTGTLDPLFPKVF